MARPGTEPLNPFHARQRLLNTDPRLSNRILQIVCLPEDQWSEEDRIIVHSSGYVARNPNLGYWVGVALERGLFNRCGDNGGRELVAAADIYAGLHRQVWGRLIDDIESAITRRWGHRAFELLLEVGNVKAPAAPASHFRQLVAGTPSPPSEPDPAEYQRRRLRLADRYGEARAVLTRTSLSTLLIVENVVIEGIRPGFLRAGAPLTARGVEDQEAFVAGLNALADHFGLFDRETRRERAAKGEGVACS